jgi:hypothetical protein
MIKRQIYPHIWDTYFKLRSKYKIIFKRPDFDPTRVPIFLDPVSLKERELSNRLMDIDKDMPTATMTAIATPLGKFSNNDEINRPEHWQQTSDDLLEIGSLDKKSHIESDIDNSDEYSKSSSIFEFSVQGHPDFGNIFRHYLLEK